MTLAKALPVLALAGILDLFRMFFEMFWFFGPAIASVYCSIKVENWIGSAWGLTKAICAAGAAAAGTAVSEVTIPLGVIMADAVGIIAFLLLGFLIVMTNSRLLKLVSSAPLQFAAAFALSEIPIIGTLPAFLFVLWRLYTAQIKIEGAALKQWEKDHAEEQRQERERQIAQFTQDQNAQMAQIQESQEIEAANDAQYAEEDVVQESAEEERMASEAANDEQYTQEYEKAA